MNLSMRRIITGRFNRIFGWWQSLSLPAWMELPAFKVGMSAATILIIVAFVGRMSALSTAGYKTHELERQTSALENEIQKIRSTVAEYSALANVQARVAGSQMIAVKNIIYLDTDAAVVAKR